MENVTLLPFLTLVISQKSEHLWSDYATQLLPDTKPWDPPLETRNPEKTEYGEEQCIWAPLHQYACSHILGYLQATFQNKYLPKSSRRNLETF